MKTAQFPAVEQARKVVEKQAKFYMTMMSDDNESRVTATTNRRPVAAKLAPKRKKNPEAQYACTA